MKASIRTVALASGLTLVSLFGLTNVVKAQSTTYLEVAVSEVCKINSVPSSWTQSVTSLASILSSNSGNVTVTCNRGTGFNVSAYSTNGGKLKGAVSGNADVISYKIAGSGGGTSTAGVVTAFTPGTSAPGTTLGNLTTYVSACATSTGCTIPLSFALTVPSTLRADTYSDTVTFTIAGN